MATLTARGDASGGVVDPASVDVTERLVSEFPDVPTKVVMRTVCECADQSDHAHSFFAEAAARAALERT